MTTTTSATVPWDDETIKARQQGSVNKFRLKEGEVARIVLLDENAFLAMTHYSTAVKRYVRCIRDIAERCPGCEKLKDPKQRFGANVIQYKTDKRGELVLDSNKQPDFEVKLWTFGPDKFAAVRAIKKEWGDLRARDLKIQCEKEDFQELIITPLPKALWLDEGTYPGLKERVATAYKEGKYDVEKMIGRVYTIEDMEAILAGKDISRRPQEAPSEEVVSAAIADIESDLETETLAEPPHPTGDAIDFDSLLEDLNK